MKLWCWLSIPVVVLALATPAAAQDSGDKPPREYRPLPVDPKAAALLKKKLLEAQGDKELFQRMLDEVRKNPKEYEAILQKKGVKPGDLSPEGQKLLEELNKRKAEGTLDPEKFKQDLLKKLEQQSGGQKIDAKDLASKIHAFDHKSGPVNMPDVTPSEHKGKLDQFLGDALKNAQNGKFGSKLQNDPAVKEAAIKMFQQQGGGGSKMAGGSAEAMEKAMGGAGLDKIAGDKADTPVLEWLNLAKKDGAGATGIVGDGAAKLGNLANPPPLGMPAAAGAATGGLVLLQILLILIVAGVAFYLVWQLLSRVREQAAEAARRRLAWPVHPGQVTTRAQLILAFEHLAIVVLGPAARTTNHRGIARELGAAPQRGQAAEELATLYERARYDPVPGELPPADLEAARRDLALLAGMAAS